MKKRVRESVLSFFVWFGVILVETKCRLINNHDNTYTHTGERLTWAEFEARRATGEELYIGEYPKEDKKQFKEFAHSHTKAQTEKWLNDQDFSLDIMYTNGRPDCYDKWSGESAGIRCTDGYLWN